MVAMRMVKASWMSNGGVLVGRSGPGIEHGQYMAVQKITDLVICNTQKIASSYLVSS